MTTNNPGSANQQPLYGCTSCYEDWTWPASDLRVFGSECWCDLCWDERRWDFPDQPDWCDLEPYTPALQAECEKLVEALSTLRGCIMETRGPDAHSALVLADAALSAYRSQGGGQ